jgi:hypothetical protein
MKLKKKTQKNNLSKLKLTYQTHDPYHEIRIILWKVNRKNDLIQHGLTR